MATSTHTPSQKAIPINLGACTPERAATLFSYTAKLSVYALSLYLVIGAIYIRSFDNIFSLYVVNCFTTLFYLLVLLVFSQDRIHLKLSVILSVVFFYNIFFVGVYNGLFFMSHGDFFEFGARDSLQYHTIATNMASVSFSNGWDYLPGKWGVDDYGFPLYISLLYRMVESPLIVSFVNVFLNTFTVYFIYGIGRCFLSKKYACFASLVFGLSTYAIYYQSNGLKETLLVFLIVGSFYYYYRYLLNGRSLNILVALVWCLSIFFFRVPLVFFVLFSFILSEMNRMKLFSRLIRMKFNFRIVSFIIVSLISMTVLLYTNYSLLGRYFSLIIRANEIREATFDQNTMFVYLTSFIAGFLGPLPTIIPHAHNMNLSILSGSLIIKVFLSIYFIFGIYVGIKNRFILPIATFCLLEIISLSYVLESFEFRKCFPHIAFLILISVYGIQYLGERKNHQYFFWKKVIGLYYPCITLTMFFWNYLRI